MNFNTKPYRLLLLLAVLLSAASGAFAEAEKLVGEVHYLELKPGIIANFDTRRARPRLLNADITLQLSSKDDVTTIRKYLVPIRHDLIMMFSGLTTADTDSGEKIELLRLRALESVQASLAAIGTNTPVSDLLFTKFVTE